MQMIAVVSGEERDCTRCGVKAGVLARGDVACRCERPDADLVDRLAVLPAPDLLLFDADLPGFPALHAVKTLRRFTGYMLTPIFVVSERDWSAEARAAGATVFLKKPVDLVELEEAVSKFVKPAVRKAPRKGLRSPCVVTKGGLKIEGRLCDVSLSGAQVALAERLPVGSMIHLGFAVILQKSPHIIKCNARVVREVPGGYGLAFCQLDPSSRSLLNAYSKS
jgi:CheY-like chemotaxis protein